MKTLQQTHKNNTQQQGVAARHTLIEKLPVQENRATLAGIATTYLEGGAGAPLVLLHGPGESALWWMRVIPRLVKHYRVIAPDLPGHGESGLPDSKLSGEVTLAWLEALIRHTCRQQPVLIGHVLGGALAARFALTAPQMLTQLVLVDSLGLSPFRPAPLFAFELFRFMLAPNEKRYLRFLPQCMYDVDALRREMGASWEPFLAYNLACAKKREGKEAVKALMGSLGFPKIPDKELQGLSLPVSLIWGRHDQANKLKIARTASQKFSWPLHIIEDCRDDPKLEKPEAFLEALFAALEKEVESGAAAAQA